MDIVKKKVGNAKTLRTDYLSLYHQTKLLLTIYPRRLERKIWKRKKFNTKQIYYWLVFIY